MIHIEERPYAVSEFRSGIYTRKVQWEDEIEITEYPFTVSASWQENTSQIFIVDSIIWLEEIPSDSSIIEEQIAMWYGGITK